MSWFSRWYAFILIFEKDDFIRKWKINSLFSGKLKNQQSFKKNHWFNSFYLYSWFIYSWIEGVCCTSTFHWSILPFIVLMADLSFYCSFLFYYWSKIRFEASVFDSFCNFDFNFLFRSYYWQSNLGHCDYQGDCFRIVSFFRLFSVLFFWFSQLVYTLTQPSVMKNANHCLICTTYGVLFKNRKCRSPNALLGIR